MPADCNCFTATTTVQAGVDYSYAYTNGSGEATPRPNFSVTGPTVLPTAYFDGNGQVPMGTIQRQGALFGEYFTTTTGGEVYTWCDEDGDVVAQFVGNNHFTPSELGTYTLKISTPDCPSGSGAQLFSPYTITTLDGCCDGILLDNIGN